MVLEEAMDIGMGMFRGSGMGSVCCMIMALGLSWLLLFSMSSMPFLSVAPMSSVMLP